MIILVFKDTKVNDVIKVVEESGNNEGNHWVIEK